MNHQLPLVEFWELAVLASRWDFKEPPTPVGGIPWSGVRLASRWDFNEPPTPVGGIPCPVKKLRRSFV